MSNNINKGNTYTIMIPFPVKIDGSIRGKPHALLTESNYPIITTKTDFIFECPVKNDVVSVAVKETKKTMADYVRDSGLTIETARRKLLGLSSTSS